MVVKKVIAQHSDRLRVESDRARRYFAAVPYRLGADPVRFVRQTHQGLPLQPPPERRTLVLFAHFDPQGVVDPYVVHYVNALYELGAAILFVSGSPKLTPDSIAPLRPLCAGIYTRRTLAMDFGSWHLAWSLLKQRGWSLDQFDRLVLANDSVFAPIFPLDEMWRTFHDADMYGAIESGEFGAHLQSFFLAWDLNCRTRAFLHHFWENFHYVVDKVNLVDQYEIGLTRRARQAGLSIKPFLSEAMIRQAYERAPDHEWAGKFSGEPFNNTLYFWDGLIQQFRFPFLKTILPRHNQPWHDSITQLRDFIEEHTPYPYVLIERNVDRLGGGWNV